MVKQPVEISLESVCVLMKKEVSTHYVGTRCTHRDYAASFSYSPK